MRRAGDDDDDDDDDGAGSERSHSRATSAGSDRKGSTGSVEDYSDDEDEGEEGYKVGGYHRVKIGEVYNQR